MNLWNVRPTNTNISLHIRAVWPESPLSTWKLCHQENTPIEFWPLKPHFYTIQLGFTWVHIKFLISTQNDVDCGYPLEPPRRGGFNKYPQYMFLSRNMKATRIFRLKLFILLLVKRSIYLNRRVFVMVFGYPKAHSDFTDHTVQMLIWIFAGNTCPNALFLTLRFI